MHFMLSAILNLYFLKGGLISTRNIYKLKGFSEGLAGLFIFVLSLQF